MYIFNRVDLAESGNDSIINWLNSQKNKRKFRLELNSFEPKDFGIKKFETKNFDRTTQKLTEVPIFEDRIPKLSLSENQERTLRDLGINPILPEERNISRILPLDTNLNLWTQEEMDELLNQVGQIKRNYENKLSSQKAMEEEAENRQRQMDEDQRKLEDDRRLLTERMNSLDVKDQDLNQRISEVEQRETAQERRSLAMNEYQEEIQTKYDDLIDKVKENEAKESHLAAQKDNIRGLFKKYNIESKEYHHIIPDSPSKDLTGSPEIVKQYSGMKTSRNTQSILDPKTQEQFHVHHMTSFDPIQGSNQNPTNELPDPLTPRLPTTRLTTPPGLNTQNYNTGYRPRPRESSFRRSDQIRPAIGNIQPGILDPNPNWRPRMSHNPMMTHQSTVREQNFGQYDLPRPVSGGVGLDQVHSPIPLPPNVSNIWRPMADGIHNSPQQNRNFVPNSQMYPTENVNYIGIENQHNPNYFEKFKMETPRMDISSDDNLEHFLDTFLSLSRYVSPAMMHRWILNILIKNEKFDLIPFMNETITSSADSFVDFLRKYFGSDEMNRRRRFTELYQKEENAFAFFRRVYRSFYVSRGIQPPLDHTLIASEVERQDIRFKFISSLKNEKLREKLWTEEIPFNDLPLRAHKLEEILDRSKATPVYNVMNEFSEENKSENTEIINFCDRCGSNSHNNDHCYASPKNRSQYTKRRASRERGRYRGRSKSPYRGERYRSNSRDRKSPYRRPYRSYYRSYSRNRSSSPYRSPYRKNSKSPGRRNYRSYSRNRADNSPERYYNSNFNSRSSPSENRNGRRRSKSPHPSKDDPDWRNRNRSKSPSKIRFANNVSSAPPE